MVETAQHGRRRGQGARRLRRVQARPVEPLARRVVVLVVASSSSSDRHPGALVGTHRRSRLALPAGGRGRRVDRRQVGVRAVADGQELVEGGVHGQRVLLDRPGGGVEDVRERVLVQELGEGGDLGEPRQQRRRRRRLLVKEGAAAGGRTSSTTAGGGRVEAADVVEAAGGSRVVVVEVVVVGERRHHRRRLAGLVVDPAQHPVVQLHARTARRDEDVITASCHGHRCQHSQLAN